MKELNLHEEIIKSLKLISYDRTLTLNEQEKFKSRDIPSDLLKPNINTNLPDYKKNTLLDPKFFEKKQKGFLINNQH
jgi:hypothetical protein